MHLFAPTHPVPETYTIRADDRALHGEIAIFGHVEPYDFNSDCNLTGEPMIWPSWDAFLWHRKLALQATETDGFHL